MRNDELTYDWLDFLAEQKSAARSIKEIKASQTNPKAADMFGNYEYEMASGDYIKITNNPPPMGTAKLFCTAQNKVIQKVQFHAKFIADLEKAYREGSTRYCPMSAGGFKARKVRNKNSLKLPPEQRSLSNHSFGAAIDFNSEKNPFKKGFTSEVEGFPEFIAAFEKNKFTWLGDGIGRQGPGHPGDDMHFEIRVDGEALNTVDDKAEADTSGGASGKKLADFYGRFGPTGQPQGAQFPRQQSPAATVTAESLNKKLLKENIISVPNNLNRKPRNVKIEGIVIHHTATNSAQSTLRVLEKRGYSTNFEVDQSGKIYQYIDPTNEYAIATGGGANKHTVAIDITTGDGSWPPAQIQAAKALIYSLAQKFGFQVVPAPDKGPYSWDSWKNKGFTLFRHRNFAATACPTNFPIDQIAGPASFSVDLSNMQQMSYSDSEEREHESDTSGGASGNKLADFFGRFGSSGQPQTIQSPQQQNTKATLTAESINNEIFKIVDKTEEKIYKKYKKYFESLLNHLKKELKITKSVKIVFEDDKENSKKVLGRTGGYLNEESKIHIFTTGRHVKDIMRSLSHEMVHHRQNIRGEFKKAEPTENGYAQKNPHLRKMEKEAFLKGNMLFRDWEDNYKYRGEK